MDPKIKKLTSAWKKMILPVVGYIEIYDFFRNGTAALLFVQACKKYSHYSVTLL